VTSCPSLQTKTMRATASLKSVSGRSQLRVKHRVSIFFDGNQLLHLTINGVATKQTQLSEVGCHGAALFFRINYRYHLFLKYGKQQFNASWATNL